MNKIRVRGSIGISSGLVKKKASQKGGQGSGAE